MEQKLLSSFGKRGVNLDLLTKKIDIEDTTYLSKYFVVAEFNPIFTAGKNSFAFNGSSLLKIDSEIQVQCIDSNGNSLYLEYPKGKTQFVDVANFVVSIHVYNENYNGSGKLILVGTTANNEIVRWMANISIDKTLQNVSKTRFNSTPILEARSLLYPVIDTTKMGVSPTIPITFTGSFYSYAITPLRDTIQSYINPKKTNTDYRLFYNVIDPNFVGPQTYSTKSFNSQMEGQTIVLMTDIIQEPFSYQEKRDHVSASFTIKKVIDSKTIQLSDAFFYAVGKNQVVTNINVGQFTSSYKWVTYNIQSDMYLKYPGSTNETVTYAKESYAEIVYRNIRPFTGFVARHKLYRKSLVYPGDFTLISDEPLGIREILVDPITPNKSYPYMGNFYNQYHIEKYWFTSSRELQLSHSVTPHIDSMKIGRFSSSFESIDGTRYVIVKTDSVDTISNNYAYVPYDATQFNELQGLSYNSNFIDLKSGSLYVLSMNLSVEKDKFNTNAKVTFFFTSSTPEIIEEKYYIPPFGLKLGEININEYTDVKYFSDKQMLYFIPIKDYYGTLVIVPYQCSPTISELSLGVYGDYGFSPDTLITKVPFDVKVKGEPFQLKAELFDINSTLIYSDLNVVQTFDANGESLFEYIPPETDISTTITTGKRMVGYSPSMPATNTNGTLYYTNISDVSVIPTNNDGVVVTDDYINVTTIDGTTKHNGRSIAVHYSGSNEYLSGRKIYIEFDGTKHVYQ